MGSHSLGRDAETIGLEWLIERGFILCYRNYRIKGGEIDLIMETENHLSGSQISSKILHFIEVKSSSSLDEHSLTYLLHAQKKRYMIRTANHFLTNFPHFLKYTIQFDLLFIDTSNRHISFYEDVITVDNYGT
jgi:Holliday junction resolvase-like predicted endonuclease